MRKAHAIVIGALLLMLLILGFGVAPVHAQGVSQIVIACTTPPPQSTTANGCRSTELAPPPGGTPPIIIGSKLLVVAGFWVWCQNPNGGTPYGPDCNGSVYVEEVNLGTGAGSYQATSVSGDASPTGPTGLQVSFTSSDGDLSCVLDVPASPAKGGTNTLSGLCDGVPIKFFNTVAQVTGK
jgi:hypothetical protein